MFTSAGPAASGGSPRAEMSPTASTVLGLLVLILAPSIWWALTDKSTRHWGRTARVLHRQGGIVFIVVWSLIAIATGIYRLT